ncbi:MAG TPA: ADP-forming succinate--CoA ligase subunit beta [Candidatus Thermoplasmatota archaeon]|nr:ADP-forming succinate--CoA ligase subunit beta [Candidatus Thermoplasmatota archaeon]
MKLYEYQGRQVFERFGIPTPSGVVVSSMDELEKVKDRLQYPLVVKAQVLVGGRGKAGGIQFADSWEEAKTKTRQVLGMDIKGLTVEKVFLVQKLDFAKELYCSVLLDRSRRQPMILFSEEGGVEIESVPDEKIRRVHVHPFTGFQPYHARALFKGSTLTPDVQKQVTAILQKLVVAFTEMDAELLEINPMAITPQGKVLAADAKVILDADAEWRHAEFQAPAEEKTALEREADEKGIAFIQLDGRIGIIANGAGLTMATLDAIKHYGGEPGIFLDLGGTDNPEKVRECVLLMRKANPTVMLLNLFGGITKSDTVAKGLKMVLDQEKIEFPIVTRIKGVNEEEARAILKEAGLYTTNTLQEAAKLTVEIEKAVVNHEPLPALSYKVDVPELKVPVAKRATKATRKVVRKVKTAAKRATKAVKKAKPAKAKGKKGGR